MFKKLLFVVSLALVGFLSYKVAYAYFSATDTTAENTFETGELTIEVSQDNMAGGISPVISNWFPGDTAVVRFEVKNTSPKDVNLAAYALGSWNVSGLDDTLVRAIKVEAWNGAAWQPIIDEPTGIFDIVYYSPDGTSSGLWNLGPGKVANLRLTVKLDETADNAYALQTYTASVKVGAVQVGGSFPSF